LLDDANGWNHKGYYNANWRVKPSTYEWRDSVFVRIE
jgi:hypothetical protein